MAAASARLKTKKIGIYGRRGNPLFYTALGLTTENMFLLPESKTQLKHYLADLPGFFWSLFFSKFPKSRKEIFFSLHEHLIKKYQIETVVTFLDNSTLFYELANRANKVQFIAIQNGVRLWTFKDIFANCPYESRARFLCFGPVDKQYIHESAISLANVHAIGSVLADYHFEQCVPAPKTYDLCVISQWREEHYDSSKPSEHDAVCLTEGMDQLLKHVLQYQKHHSVRVVVAGASEGNAKEHAFYQKYFGSNLDFFYRNHEAFHSYGLVRKSKVTIGSCSTILYETLGMPEKVLFCNFSKHKRHWFPEHIHFRYVIRHEKRDYETFERRLSELIDISPEDYVARNQLVISHLMSHNKDYPAHRFVSDLIVNRQINNA